MSESTVHNLIDAIDPLSIGLALKLAGAKAGATRDLPLILAECEKYNADPRIVGAIFGFGIDARQPDRWIDFLLGGSEVEPLIDSVELSDAYTLAVTIFGDLVAEHRATADRIIGKLKHSDVTRSPHVTHRNP